MQVFKVQGMSCEHCVRVITRAVQVLDEAAEVEVDLAGGEVRVSSRLSVAELEEAIRGEGYEVSP
jgi:copper chaperone